MRKLLKTNQQTTLRNKCNTKLNTSIVVLINEKSEVERKLSEETEKLFKEIQSYNETKKELANIKKRVGMVNLRTKDLNEILAAQKTGKGKKGIDILSGTNFGKTLFVKAKSQNQNHQKQDKTSQQQPRMSHNEFQPRDDRICYNCNKRGHIHRKCREFNRNYQRTEVNYHQEWRIRNAYYVAYNATFKHDNEMWYLTVGVLNT